MSDSPNDVRPIPAKNEEDQQPKLQEGGEAKLRSRKVLGVGISRSFSGPLPPPEILRSYNDILPGSAERILRMAENQQSHRFGLERMVVDANCASQRWGLVFGFLVAITAVGGGLVLVYMGRSASGLATVITALAALVGVFIYGKRSQERELEEKSAELKPE